MYKYLIVLGVVYYVSAMEIETVRSEYKYFPVSNNSVHFQVKAASEALIALTTKAEKSDPMVEIVIGGWSNSNNAIRRLFRTVPNKVTAETPGILSGSELRGFWVSWDGGNISVGRKGASEPFMSWTDPDPFPVAYVGVGSRASNGSWIIEESPSVAVTATSVPGEVIVSCRGYIHTEDKVEYKFFPVSNTSVQFKVKAANDAHLTLTTGPQQSDLMVEIIIGGWNNSNSAIRRLFRTVPDKVTVETPGILSRCELRGFWISWDSGVVLVGREGVVEPFMSWADPDPFPVAFVGVHTGWRATGFWIIECKKFLKPDFIVSTRPPDGGRRPVRDPSRASDAI